MPCPADKLTHCTVVTQPFLVGLLENFTIRGSNETFKRILYVFHQALIYMRCMPGSRMSWPCFSLAAPAPEHNKLRCPPSPPDHLVPIIKTFQNFSSHQSIYHNNNFFSLIAENPANVHLKQMFVHLSLMYAITICMIRI